VSGGSWGSTLALAYAEAHPDRVSAIVLAAVTTSSRAEIDWISEQVGRIFPREWDEFAQASGRRPGQRVVEAYFERLTDPDPAVRSAAAVAWCRWEDTHVSLDPAVTPDLSTLPLPEQESFALHVVNSWAHDAFLGESGIMDHLDRIVHLPAIFIHGRLDVSGPLVTAWELHRSWPGSTLIVQDREGHYGPGARDALIAAYDELWPRLR
jgi:proline iminopeptidase